MPRSSVAEVRYHMLKLACGMVDRAQNGEGSCDNGELIWHSAGGFGKAAAACGLPGLSERTCDRYLRRLEADGFARRVGRGRYALDKQRIFDAFVEAQAVWRGR